MALLLEVSGFLKHITRSACLWQARLNVWRRAKKRVLAICKTTDSQVPRLVEWILLPTLKREAGVPVRYLHKRGT